MDKYTNEFDIGFFHWGVMAATERYLDTKQIEFIEFSEMLVSNFLQERSQVNPNTNSCYMVEGLAAFVLAADRYPEVYTSDIVDRVTQRVEKEMTKNLRTQITGTTIEFSHSRVESDYLEVFAGGFRNGTYSLRTRIDYSQHCLSALLKLKEVRMSQ